MPPIEVLVPATTANLGPGFDVLGAALRLYNRFIFSPAEQFSIQVKGPHSATPSFPLNEHNLVYQMVQLVCRYRELEPPPLAITLDMHIPPGRGLGSSATAIVAGLLAGNALLADPLSTDQLLAMAIAEEGHPDNVAPALLGGCLLNVPNGGRFHLPVPPELQWILCIPAFELSTRSAREALPPAIPMQDCIFNLGSLASLVAGFYTSDAQKLAWGLQDRLHQPYREQLVPGLQPVIAAAREAGALGSVLSGAGPTVLALALEGGAAIAAAMQETWRQFDIQAETVITTIDTVGAVVKQ